MENYINHSVAEGEMFPGNAEIWAQIMVDQVVEIPGMSGVGTNKALEQIFFLEFDRAGVVTGISDFACRLSGYQRSEALAEDNPVMDAEFANLLRFESSADEGEHFGAQAADWQGEVRFFAKNETPYWLEATVSSIKGDDGAIEKYVLCGIDISRIKQNQLSLQSDLEVLTSTLEYFPGGISIIDAELDITFTNNEFYELLDIPKSLFPVGANLENVLRFNAERGDYGEGDTEEMVRFRIDLARKFEQHAFERMRPDGTYIEVRGTPLPTGGFVTTYVDVTGRKNAEELTQRLAKIVEDSLNEVFVFDSDTLKFLQVNSSACENLGYTVAELQQLTPLDLKPDFTDQRFEDLIAPLRSGAKTHINFETIHRRKDGSTYDAKVTLQQIAADGRTVFAAIIEDVTALNRAQKEAEEARKRLLNAIEAIDGGFALYDADDRLIMCNSVYRQSFDFEGAQDLIVPGIRLEDMLRIAAEKGQFRAANGRVKEWLANRMQMRRVMVGTIEHQMRDGSWRRVAESRTNDGGTVTIFVDVTKEKRLELELKEHRDRLQDDVDQATGDLKRQALELQEALSKEKELNELQRQFVTMASHEFRTPLAIIDSTAQRIKRKIDGDKLTPEDALAQVDTIRSAVNRMARLMESTLSVARMDEFGLEVKIADCDLSRVIMAAVNAQREISKTCSIVCDLESVPATIRCDAGAVEQVISNLLSNAVKYSPVDPRIEVKGWVADGNLYLSVKDNGLGISQEDMPQMFTRFFRAKSSTGIEGTGIGLNFAKRLIDLHDGDISIQSRVGGGSTFIVRLPESGPKKGDVAPDSAA